MFPAITILRAFSAFVANVILYHYIVGLWVVFIFVMLVSVLVLRVISSNMYLKKTI